MDNDQNVASQQEIDQFLNNDTPTLQQPTTPNPGTAGQYVANLLFNSGKKTQDSIEPDHAFNTMTELAAGAAAPMIGRAMIEGAPLANEIIGNEVGAIGKDISRNVGKGIKAPEWTQEIPKSSPINPIEKAGASTKPLSEAMKAQKANRLKRYANGGQIPDDWEPKMAEGGDPIAQAYEQAATPPVQQEPQQSNIATQQEIDQFLEPSEEEKYGSLSQQAIAGLEGAGEGIAGPLSTMAETAVGVPKEDILGRREVNPITHALGQGAGLAGSMMTGVGEGALVAKGAAKLIPEGMSVAARLGSAAGKAALENIAIQTGDETTRMIINDPNQSAQTAIADIGLAGLLGGTLGASVEGVNALWSAKYGNKVGQFIEDTKAGLAEHIAGGDPVEHVTQELSDLHNSITQHADEVYGASGLKAQELHKVMPEMNDKMIGHMVNNINRLEDTIAKMNAKPNAYPARLTARLQADLDVYKDSILSKVVRTGAKETIVPGVPEVAQEQVNFTPVEFRENPNRQAFPWLRDEDTANRVIRGETQPIQKKILNANPSEPVQMTPIDFRGKTPAEIFNATQDLKQTLQSYAKFDKFVKPVDEAYDFVRQAKGLAHDLRESLEDTKVWGKAAERQKTINKAFSEYLPTLKDFQKSFMSLVNGDLVINPGKVQTFMNQIEKPSGKLKRDMLNNFIKASNKYKDVIGETHANLGIDSPIEHTTMHHLMLALKDQTPGSKFARYLVDKGIGETVGTGAGGLLGGLFGHPVLGAIAGKHSIAPFLNSVLPALVKPMMEKAATHEGVRSAVDYGMAVARGDNLIKKASKAMFKAGQMILPESAIPKDRDIEKLNKHLKNLRDNPQEMMTLVKGSNYLPEHDAAMTSSAQNAVSHLNSLRPNNVKEAPLDSDYPLSKVQQGQFKQQLMLAQQPLLIMSKVKSGSITMDDIKVIRTLYPALYDKLSSQVQMDMIDHVKKNGVGSVSYKTRIGMSMFTGQPMDSTFTPMSIISAQPQSPSTAQPQQAPQGKKQKGSPKALEKLPGSYSTPSQNRAKNQQTKD